MSDEKVALVRTVFEAIRSGDRAAYLPRIDPGLRIEPSTNSPEQRVLEGVQGFERWISRWPALFEEYEVRPERFSVAGNDVVVALHERARSARSDLEIEDRFAHVWTVREGKVVRIRVFNNELEALDAAEPANMEIVRRWFEAVSDEDFSTALAMVHPDVELVPPGGQSPYRGAENLRRWMEPDAFREQVIQPLETVVVADRRILTRQHVTARGAGSGIELDLISWSVWTFDEDGLITRIEIYLDHESDKAREAAGRSE